MSYERCAASSRCFLVAMGMHPDAALERLAGDTDPAVFVRL
jgi:hypothetical protein